MTIGKLLIYCSVSLFATLPLSLWAQTCTTLGQTPATAFPVCGTASFQQSNVPLCGNNVVPVPCTDPAPYTDRNPFWYKFTCFSSGTLGFEVTPNTPADDYDWQLFDITGQNPALVYTDPSLFVSGNWSSNPGATGASAAGTGQINCAGPSYPNQSAMPTLIQGHVYLLLVSHFTNTQSGYSLNFSGGTASITDTTKPALAGVQEICLPVIGVTLNKKMTCASLAPDGSDFTITPLPPGVQIISATGNSCTGFDMDSITLTLNGNLIPGTTYTLTAVNGSDGNTLLDICGNQVPVGQSLTFTAFPPVPNLLDSITPPGCAPNVLKLIFNGPIQCSSIASDGSDFAVTGTSPVVVTGARGVCNANGFTNTVLVQLSAPIQTAGNYQVNLQAGSDGNTVVNFCGLATPPTSLSFTTSDTVSAAAFSGTVLYGCKQDTIQYAYPSEDGVNQWQWVFDGTDTSQVQDPPERIYSLFNSKTVSLIVSNGVCSDTTKAVYVLDNAISAKFEAPNILCPKDFAQFLNGSTGSTITSWNWDFGDGTSSDLQSPPDHLFPLTGVETKYPVTLVVGNSIGCKDTARQLIDVLRSCFIAVPGAFTPNGDGVNDYLYPLNAFKAVDLQFRVYNRQGQMVFETTDWTKKWDGTVGGHPEPAGTFAWVLSYIDGDTGKRIFQKGTSILIR
jgi:gliding motility-associated-like protein